jgi:hypothetical protein
MGRTGVRRDRIVLVAATAGVLLVGGHIAAAEGSRGAAIASRELGPQADARPLVDSILELNDLDPGALAPGRTLLIPPAADGV